MVMFMPTCARRGAAGRAGGDGRKEERRWRSRWLCRLGGGRRGGGRVGGCAGGESARLGPWAGRRAAASQLRAGRWAARAPLLSASCSPGPNAAAAVGARCGTPKAAPPSNALRPPAPRRLCCPPVSRPCRSCTTCAARMRRRCGEPAVPAVLARAGARWRALKRRDDSPLVAAAKGAGRPLQLVAAQVDLEGGTVPKELGRGHLHRLLHLLDVLRRLVARGCPAR